MKIGFVSSMTAVPWGGSEELWVDAAEAALRQGHAVAASVCRWPAERPRIRQLRAAGATVFERPAPRHHLVGRAMARVSRSFTPLARWKPDVLCVSLGATWDLVTGIEGPAARRLLDTGVPYVLVSQITSPYETLTEPRRRAAVALFTGAAAVGFVSAENLRSTERRLAAALPSARVIRNPVNLSSSEPLPWPPGPLRMACVARLLTFPKGQDVLLESLHAPAWRDRDWRLDLVGSGGDGPYFERLAAHYGLADRVRLAGHVPDVRAVWADHHLFVLSTLAEGTPLALVEAMLCGRPAVVTDVGGNAEWVEDGSNGFLAEAPTARSFGAALERAWQARDRWEEIGRRARETALSRFDPDAGGTLLRLLTNR